QINFDPSGRMWVSSSSVYPQIKPGEEAHDEVVVLEDTRHLGKADKSTVFANNLQLPTAVMPADGGCYVANSTEILFLKDTDGDGKADTRQVMLSGFGTEDTHHMIHTFRLTPEGMLSFNQSIYIHSHVETPYGVKRLMGGGVWEFRPETRKLDVFCKGLPNPWGREFDRWGQSFLTDGAGDEGINFAFPQAVFATSPGAKRNIEGLNPGQPKHAGLEIIDEPHFPDDWQDTLITCDFRGNRINRFQLTESGSGYVSKQLPDVLASKHPGFRPIDVRTGPDGALYIADWYNPIIQHGEVDFRDPRRDHTHGRIWRLTVKGRPLSKNPDFSKMDVSALLKQLESNRRWNRLFAKQQLKRSDPSAFIRSAMLLQIDQAWESGNLAGSNQMLEAAWALETINHFDSNLCKTLLTNSDHHIRAAALRILSQHINDTPDALKLLSKAITDEHPQVRLWAVACLNLMQKPEAFELALKALDKDVDNNIDFLLDLSAREQADIWLPVFLKGDLKLNNNPKHLIYALKASGKPEALQPLLDALASGKLSDADANSVFSAAGDMMDSTQAAALAEMADKLGDGEKNSGRLDSMLGALDKAAMARGVRPANAEAMVLKWLHQWQGSGHVWAATLAGRWKVEKAREDLEMLASRKTGGIISAGIQGLSLLGGEKSRDVINNLAGPDHPDFTRCEAINALATLAPDLAAKRAVEFLTTTKPTNEGALVIQAFIKNNNLPDLLANELEGKAIPEAVAVEGIRIISSHGVKGPLEAALQKAGNIKQMNRTLTPEEMNAMMAKVKTQGDPARGEQVFRRQQLLCFTCHAIGGAGGTLGPDIVSLGAAAPVDYIIESLLEPSKKIKEGFNMTMVTMKDGQVMAGMIAQDGVGELVLRDAANQFHKLAKSNIAKRETSPISMMPPGLTASLREDEFVDLVRFLSELGKEGDYKVKPTSYIRSWRVMDVMNQSDVEHVSHAGLPALNDRTRNYPWRTSYSAVNGALPLYDIAVAKKLYPWTPKIIQCDLQMDAAGKVSLKLSESKNIFVAVGETAIKEVSSDLTLDLPAGKSVVTFAISSEAGDLKAFSVEITGGPAKVVTGM
ncbi:MAG: PVC-type heme-binding CxxCH protein, partial [Verrucomicrobiaceae bacterium]